MENQKATKKENKEFENRFDKEIDEILEVGNEV